MGKLVNRAQMTVSGAPGAGTITLGAAVSGYQTLAAAGINDQDIVSYVAVDGSAWEVGEGLYTASGTTLARGLVSSSTGSLLSLDANSIVFVDANRQDLRTGGVRQTVQSGPITTSGAPNFLPTSSASLSLVSQNIAPATPLIVSAAKGFDSRGPYDRLGAAAANLTWTLPVSAGTYYLYVVVNTDGSLTPGSTTVQPSYSYGTGTLSTTSGAFKFDFAGFVGYMGNGSSAPQAYIVFVGELTNSGSELSGVVAYAYNGFYDSGFTATLPGANVAVSKITNLGVDSVRCNLVLQCLSTDAGYAVGDQLFDVFESPGASIYMPQGRWASRNATGFTVGAQYIWYTQNKAGGQVALTLANWEYKIIVSRIW